MIASFGKDEQGHYVDHENDTREYLPEALWAQFIAAGHSAGAKNIPMRLHLTERVTLDKYEGDRLIESLSL